MNDEKYENSQKRLGKMAFDEVKRLKDQEFTNGLNLGLIIGWISSIAISLIIRFF